MKQLIIIFIAILTFSNVSVADSYKFQVNITSHHFSDSSEYGLDEPWNENNLGFGIIRQYNDTHSISVGYYENSINKTSIYAFYNNSIPLYNSVKVGANVGFISGYNESVLPAIVPQISVVVYDDVELHFNIIPYKVIGLSLSFGF